MIPSQLPSQPNQSLLDGLRLLEALADKPVPVSCTSLAAELGLEVTRVNRLVKTLHALGFAYRTRSRQYGAGPGLFVLSAATLNTLGYFRNGIDALDRLRKENRVTAMGVLWRDHVSYLFHWTPGMEIQEAIGRNTLVPATQSSIGLMLLSQLPDEEVKNIYEKVSPAPYPNWKTLKKKLDETREQGWAEHPNPDGTFSIGVSVGEPAHTAIAMSHVKGAGEIDRVVALLKDTARRIHQAPVNEIKIDLDGGKRPVGGGKKKTRG